MIGSKARRLRLAGALWLGAFAVGGCTLITDVDRSKILPPTSMTPSERDGGADAGGQEPVDSGTPAPTDTPDGGATPDATVDSGIIDGPADAATDGGS